MPGMPHMLRRRAVRSLLDGRPGRGFEGGSEATTAEISTAEVSSAPVAATPVSPAPVAAVPPVSEAFVRGAAHIRVVVVEGLEDQECREPVGPEKAVAGVLELVLVLPESLALVGIHQVFVGFGALETRLELLELLLALPPLAIRLRRGRLEGAWRLHGLL